MENLISIRQKEVDEYQANIDRMRLAIDIATAQGDEAPQGFVEQLRKLLEDNIREQKKAKIMLQVEEMINA